MPTKMLVRNFPIDVQERLKPRLDSLPMSPKRILGWVILVLFMAGYVGLFVIGGLDGMKHGFTFLQFFLRFFTIGAVIKVFDIALLIIICCLKLIFSNTTSQKRKAAPDGRILAITANSRHGNAS